MAEATFFNGTEFVTLETYSDGSVAASSIEDQGFGTSGNGVNGCQIVYSNPYQINYENCKAYRDTGLIYMA